MRVIVGSLMEISTACYTLSVNDASWLTIKVGPENKRLAVHNLGADTLVGENFQQETVRQPSIHEVHPLHPFL